MVGHRRRERSLSPDYISGARWQCKFPKRNRERLLLFSTLLQPTVVLMPFYNGTEAEGRAKFKPFLDIGMSTQMRTDLDQSYISARACHGYDERSAIRGSERATGTVHSDNQNTRLLL